MKIEEPSKGRAKITDEGGDLRIVIPPSRHPFKTFQLSFLIIWMCLWLIGGGFAI